jgi:deoxyribodipyrimidine photo-lyase
MPPRILIYLLRRDLRIADNPILHEISQHASAPDAPFTHLLPVYIFTANQIELSGLISAPDLESPYPEARSKIGNFWRCGHHRAKFLAESVWELKCSLERAGCGLLIRAGMAEDVVRDALDWYADSQDDTRGIVTAIWMTGEVTPEEVQEQDAVQKVAEERNLDFKLWTDEKYFVDECALSLG